MLILTGDTQQRETAVDCVVREIREETGLKVQIDYLVGNYFRSLHNDQQAIFKVTPLNKKTIVSGPETKQIAYFPINRLPKNMVALRRRQILDTFHGRRQLEYTQKECRLSFYAEKIIRRIFKLG
ncbi:NUDIX domain-containing protein [Lentilactobacillus farraginis]|uniref:NUDIX hydrolase n=1 Tax=Lentilactobacillus farraginis TaxID=390841 RepID=UPI0009E08DB9